LFAALLRGEDSRELADVARRHGGRPGKLDTLEAEQ